MIVFSSFRKLDIKMMAKVRFELSNNIGDKGKPRKLRAIRVRVSLGYSTTIGERTKYQRIELSTGCSIEAHHWDKVS